MHMVVISALVLPQVGAQCDSIIYDDLYRTYLLHVPSGGSPSEPMPLIVAMHGGFGSAQNLQKQSGLNAKADEEGFIVVYPEGVRDGLLNIRTWNAGWCCGFASKTEVDDVGFINALLDTLIDRYPIDSERIYATGMSNGGFMSYRLACEIPQRIAAIAPVACSMSVIQCAAENPMPVIHFHSYLDKNVPYQGGVGSGVSNHHNTPLDSVAAVWSDIGECSVKADTVAHDSQFTQIKWSGCECNVEYCQYLTRDGGHSWPGGSKTPIGDPVSKYILANDLMWEFFKQYTSSCATSTSINEVDLNSGGLSFFPNPTESNIYFNWGEGILGDAIIYNVIGMPVMHCSEVKSMDMSHLTAGIYYIFLKTNEKMDFQKLIKK